jgi:hypothetical protein
VVADPALPLIARVMQVYAAHPVPRDFFDAHKRRH